LQHIYKTNTIVCMFVVLPFVYVISYNLISLQENTTILLLVVITYKAHGPMFNHHFCFPSTRNNSIDHQCMSCFPAVKALIMSN